MSTKITPWQCPACDWENNTGSHCQMCTRPQPKTSLAHQLATEDQGEEDTFRQFSSFSPFPPVPHDQFVSHPPLPEFAVPFGLYPSPFADLAMAQLPSLISFNEPLFTDYTTLLPPPASQHEARAQATDPFFAPLTHAFAQYMAGAAPTAHVASDHTSPLDTSLFGGAFDNNAHLPQSVALPQGLPAPALARWVLPRVELEPDDLVATATPEDNPARYVSCDADAEVLRAVWYGCADEHDLEQQRVDVEPEEALQAAEPEGQRQDERECQDEQQSMSVLLSALAAEERACRELTCEEKTCEDGGFAAEVGLSTDSVTTACDMHVRTLHTRAQCVAEFDAIADTLHGYARELEALVAPLQAASGEQRGAGRAAVLEGAVRMGVWRASLMRDGAAASVQDSSPVPVPLAGNSLSGIVSGMLAHCPVHGRPGWEYLETSGVFFPHGMGDKEDTRPELVRGGACMCHTQWVAAVEAVACAGSIEYEDSRYTREGAGQDVARVWWLDEGSGAVGAAGTDGMDVDNMAGGNGSVAEGGSDRRDKKDKKDKRGKDKEKERDRKDKKEKRPTKPARKEHVFGDLGAELGLGGGLDGGFGAFLGDDGGEVAGKKSVEKGKKKEKVSHRSGSAIDDFGGDFAAFLGEEIAHEQPKATSASVAESALAAESKRDETELRSGTAAETPADANIPALTLAALPSALHFSSFLATSGVPRTEPWLADHELLNLRADAAPSAPSLLSAQSARMYASASLSQVAYTSTASKSAAIAEPLPDETTTFGGAGGDTDADAEAAMEAGARSGALELPARGVLAQSGVLHVSGSMGERIANTEGQVMSPYVTPTVRLFAGRTGSSLCLLPRDTPLFARLSRMYARDTADGTGVVAIELFCSSLYAAYRRTLARLPLVRECLLWYPLYNELPAVASHGLRRDTQKAVRGASARYGDGLILHRRAATAAAESRAAQRYGEQRHYQMLLCVAGVGKWTERREGRMQGGPVSVVTEEHVVVYDDAQAYPLALVKFA